MAEDATKKNSRIRRDNISILVITGNATTNDQLRTSLLSLGYTQISRANSHVQGLEKIKERNFDSILFDARSTDQVPLEFVQHALAWDNRCVLVALSLEPKIDDVFSLLSAGARGFVVIPFTTDVLDEAILHALDGPPLSDAILTAADRDSALVGMILNSLYRLTVVMRQAREFPSAAKEIPKFKQNLVESSKLAKLFSKGSEDDLRAKIIEECLSRANRAATRLGRTRMKLKQARDQKPKTAPTTAAR